MLSSLLPAILFAATALAHGEIISPPVRQPGAAMARACGTAAVSAIQADSTGPLENIPTNDSPACNIFLCKGTQFADNAANVQTFSAGEVINFSAVLPIPHEGPCNVSIIDLESNSAVGQPLIVFDSYADENLARLPANNTRFSVTIPRSLGDRCGVPGECALQWFWFGTGAQQTYEDCVDFVVG